MAANHLTPPPLNPPPPLALSSTPARPPLLPTPCPTPSPPNARPRPNPRHSPARRRHSRHWPRRRHHHRQRRQRCHLSQRLHQHRLPSLFLRQPPQHRQRRQKQKPHPHPTQRHNPTGGDCPARQLTGVKVGTDFDFPHFPFFSSFPLTLFVVVGVILDSIAALDKALCMECICMGQ